MKITLEFDTEDDAEEYAYAINGMGYALTLQDVDAELRTQIKYGQHSGEVQDALQKIRDAVHEAADAHGVRVWQ